MRSHRRPWPLALWFSALISTHSCVSSTTPGETPAADASLVGSPADANGETGVDAGASTQAPDAGDAGWANDAGLTETIQCGMTLPGPTLNARLPEAKPDYLKELEALTLPDVLDVSKEKTAFQLALVRYLLGDVATQNQPDSGIWTRPQAESAGPLGKALLGAAVKSTRPGEVDITFLRRGLYVFYPCATQLPATLAALKQKYGDFTTWNREDLACGTAKDGPRRLWHNDELGIQVAETLEGNDIRETEVLFTKTRKDGQIEFAVYTKEGALTDRSTFPTLGAGTQTLPSPFQCMSCHYNVTTKRFDDIRPEGTGTGCRPPRDAGIVADGGLIGDAGPG
jgi:hypothetical protein